MHGDRLFAKDTPVILLGIDPSNEMLEYAQLLNTPRLAKVLRQGAWRSLSEHTRDREGYFDLVVMSACLPYGCDEPSSPQFWSESAWSRAANALAAATHAESAMIAIQPFAKKSLLDLSASWFCSGSLRKFGLNSSSFPSYIRAPVTLPKTTALFKAHCPHSWSIDSWNPTRSDEIRLLLPRSRR